MLNKRTLAFLKHIAANKELLASSTEWDKESWVKHLKEFAPDATEEDLRAISREIHSQSNDEELELSDDELSRVSGGRDILGDETKAMQTNVNQFGDTATQETGIASAMLQRLSDILTVLYR